MCAAVSKGTQAEGVGLGLAIVEAAVDLHHGSIDMGRSPFGGARFTLRFCPIERHDGLSRTATSKRTTESEARCNATVMEIRDDDRFDATEQVSRVDRLFLSSY
jgi:nitrogen-specific signal transduction histidine kinase